MIDDQAVCDEIAHVQDQITASSRMIVQRAGHLCEAIAKCIEEDPEISSVKIVGFVRATEEMNEATFQTILGLEGRINALRDLLTKEA